MPSLSNPDSSQIVQKFWETIREPGHDVIAMETQRALREICPAIDTFSFDVVDENPESGSAGGGVQTSESPFTSVEVGTPRPVVDSWNQNKVVSLFIIDTLDTCGAAIGNDIPQGCRDFKACSLRQGGGGDDLKCSWGNHVGPRVKRMALPTSDGFMIAIPVPSGTKQVKQVFSRPVLDQSDFLFLQRDSSEFRALMSYEFEPRVWKLLFELFPGAAVLDPANDVKISAPPAPNSPSRRLLSDLVSDRPISSPGLQAQSVQPPEADAGDQWDFDDDSFNTRASRKPAPSHTSNSPVPSRISQSSRFPWDSQLSRSSSKSFSRHDSNRSDAAGRAGDNWQEALRSLTDQVAALKSDLEADQLANEERDLSLGKTIRELRETNHKLKKDLSRATQSLQKLQQSSRRHPNDTQLDQALQERVAREAARNVASKLHLSEFVKKADLPDNLSGEATVPPAILTRLKACEAEFLNPAGSVAKLLDRVEVLEVSKVATAIEMGGHVFADEAATEAWARTHGDPNLHRFCVDFVSLFLLAEPKYESVKGGLEQKAAAVKANFPSLDQATIELSYSIIYPDRVLKYSDKADAQLADGYMWASQFSTFEAFEGDYHNGTHRRVKKALDTVATALLNGIDYHFPIGTRPKSNAVFKAQLQLSLSQCTEFLDSFSPLYKQIAGSGMPAKEAWSRVMIFAKQVFADVATVRAPNSEASMGSMIWSSFQTSNMLKEYQRHTWVEHPKTSSILALTSMRKEGKAIEEVNSKLTAQSTLVNRHTGDIKKIQEEIKDLKKKNNAAS